MAHELNAILENFNSALEAQESGAATSPIQAEILNLSSVDEKKQDRGLREIINYTLEERNREFIASHDGIPPIIKLAQNSYPEHIRTLAAHGLANLALDGGCRARIRSAKGIPALISGVSSGNAGLKERSLAALANLTIAEDDIRVDVSRDGGIGPIVQSVNSSGVEVTRTALMVIANLGVNRECTVSLVSQGAVEACSRHLSSSDPVAKKHALWALAAMSGEPSSHSRMEGDIGRLGAAIRGGDAVDVIKSLTAIVNLSGNESAHHRIITEGLVSPIMGHLNGSELNAKVLALQAVQNLALSDAGRHAIQASGAAGNILNAVRSLQEPLVAHGLRAVTNVSQDPEIRQKLRSQGGVDVVSRYVNSSDHGVRSSAEQALNNLTA